MRPVSSLCGAIAVFLYAAGCCTSDPGMMFTRHPQPLAAPLGDEVYFECSLNLAAEKFAWRHRQLGSKEWGPFNYTSNGAKTSKHVVNFDDESKAGDYRCIAYYGTSGLASDPARLDVAKMDKFSDKSDVEIRVAVGNVVPITCPVPYSLPEAIVEFYKNGKPMENVNVAGGSKTMIIETAKSTDSGSYHCAAANYISSERYFSNRKTILTVHTGTAYEAPRFVKQPQTEYKVLRGKNVTMECFAVGNPVPRVTWTRLGSSLPGDSRSWYTAAGLTIVNVQSSDRGEYDCAWSNNANSVKSVIILTVVELPRVLKPPKPVVAAEGGEMELSCAVFAQPEPTLEWLINGESLSTDDNAETKGSVLFVSPVEKKHAGIVQCVANNEYGSDSGYNQVRVIPKQHIGGGATEIRADHGRRTSGHVHREHTRGGGKRRSKEGKHKDHVFLVPPDRPTVTRLSDMSVMVRWSVPENEGLSIEFFKVQYRELGQKMNGKQSKWMTANIDLPSHVRSHEVTDLQPDRTYKFRIAAVYSNDDNKLSKNSVRFYLNRTGGFERNKMPIPLLIDTEALGPRQVLLLWESPNTSVHIDGFYVYHRASTSAGDYVKTAVEGKDATNVTISYLQPDTTYEFKIQSFSVAAASEFSRILRQKTTKATTEPPVRQVLAENKSKPVESSDEGGSTYAVIGGASGGALLLGGLAAVAVMYKRNKQQQQQQQQQQSRESPRNHGKPITNGRLANGGTTDSKINITSNPLAGLDTAEDTPRPKSAHQSSMEMASFLNGQNNNSNNHNNSDSAGSGINASPDEPSLLQGSLPIEQPL